MTDVVEVSLHIDAEPATVFEYFVDPQRYVEWMGREAALEPTPGGTYRVWMRDGVEARGQFVVVEPPHRVEFTWGWTNDQSVPPGSSRVVVTLEPEAGGTRLVLQHHDLPAGGQRDHHREGWLLYVGRLSARASGAEPEPDPNC